MKFLTDENIATSVVHALRNAEFDVKDIKEEKLQGTTDKEILDLALREKRVIITHDKDYAELVIVSKKESEGVILIKLKNQSADHVKERLFYFLKSRLFNKVQRNLVTITESQIIVHKNQ